MCSINHIFQIFLQNLSGLKSKHEGVKHLCDQCDFKTPQQGTLSRHIKSKHEGVKYPCDQCD
ncbi:MAG: hypothetical protein GY699_26640 [Desulfobacteraceae bacterium]|nr:hypothetical protein [Desulfobacteraceae bacterium]MCP4052331.1 hypothetical protein [Mesoflavibacter sp.]